MFYLNFFEKTAIIYAMNRTRVLTGLYGLAPRALPPLGGSPCLRWTWLTPGQDQDGLLHCQEQHSTQPEVLGFFLVVIKEKPTNDKSPTNHV
jgi:hypothetical protein